MERRGGEGVWKWGKREIIYLLLHCHHQNDFCIKMGSYESHFKVSLSLWGTVTRQCPQTTTFMKRKESRSGIRGPSASQPNTLPLGQTGSHCSGLGHSRLWLCMTEIWTSKVLSTVSRKLVSTDCLPYSCNFVGSRPCWTAALRPQKP